MVNRNGIQSFVLFVVALFSQRSQFPVWTKCLNMQRLNNLSQGDCKNIHFMATCESVYLRQQRQTLERGEARWKKKKKITTRFCRKQREKHENEIRWSLHFRGVNVWFQLDTGRVCLFFFYLSCLTWLSRWNQATSFIFFPLVLLDLYLFSFLLICRGVLMRNQLSTPNFINMSDVTIWFTICPPCG